MVNPEVIVSGTVTGVEVNEHVAVNVRHGVRYRDLLRLVDDALDLGGDVDLAARIGERRVGDDAADQHRLGAQIQLAGHALGDFGRSSAVAVTVKSAGIKRVAGLGQAQR